MTQKILESYEMICPDCDRILYRCEIAQRTCTMQEFDIAMPNVLLEHEANMQKNWRCSSCDKSVKPIYSPLSTGKPDLDSDLGEEVDAEIVEDFDKEFNFTV